MTPFPFGKDPLSVSVIFTTGSNLGCLSRCSALGEAVVLWISPGPVKLELLLDSYLSPSGSAWIW